LGNININEKEILKLMLQKNRVWAGLNWVRTGSLSGSTKTEFLDHVSNY
jgi:hypothetical protein